MKETPAMGMASASGNVAVGTANSFQIALRPLEIQTHRLRQRFGIPAATAAALAELAYPSVETGRRA